MSRSTLSVIARSLFLFLAIAVGSLQARAADEESIVLVAKRELHGDPLYASTILIAKPLPDGRALGFIMNKPSRVRLGEVFPQDEPSQKVVEPIYVGGPEGMQLIFALVKTSEAPGEGAVKLAADLYLAIDGKLVDKVIRGQPEQARFFAGFVVWQPGELEQEMKRGLWYAMQTDAQLLMRQSTDGLWEDLVGRSERRAGSI